MVLFLAAKRETLRARGTPAHANMRASTDRLPSSPGNSRGSPGAGDGHRAARDRAVSQIAANSSVSTTIASQGRSAAPAILI